MRLWQKIYIMTLLVFLPVLNVGLFMGARMIFSYNMEALVSQVSDEVHLLSHSIVNEIEQNYSSKEQMRDDIVYAVSGNYVEYVRSKDSNAVLEVHFVGEKTDLHMGMQNIMVVDTGHYPEMRAFELLEPPYESYQLYYYKPLDDFFDLWQALKIIFAVISLCCSVVLAAVLYMMLYEMTSPLQKLNESVKLMQNGEKWKPVEVRGKDDIANLTQSFNEMGAEIAAQMAKLQKESLIKQQLVDDLAHEMRTPLTAIYGYAEYLQKAPYTEEELYDALEYIMSESKRLTRLGQELLTLAVYREDEGSMESIRTEELYKVIASMLEATLQEKRLKLVKKVKSLEFEGDKDMLICLLRNLIENAVRASESGCRIWVTMVKVQNQLKLQVKDEGIGMEEQELERITDAFYRVDKARSRSNGGAGIGLNLCELIVKKHSGTMGFESKPGEGTTVTVLLPLKRGSSNEV